VRSLVGAANPISDCGSPAGSRFIVTPLALWEAKGTVGELYNVLETWRDKGVQVSGKALDCGHLLPEKDPGSILSELKKFFGAAWQGVSLWVDVTCTG